MTMTLVPIDGALAVISKMETRDPEAATALLRFSLFDSAMCQANELEGRISKDVLTHMAAINKVARTKMLRSHVGKAISGESEPDDLEYAKALGMLDTWVEKGLIGSMLAAFNQRVHRDEGGRFASGGGGRTGAINVMTGSGSEGREGRREDAGHTAGAMYDGQHMRSSNRLAEQWYGSTQGVNRQAYNRLNVTGQALQAIGKPGSTTHAAGTVAQFAGQLGPEAERVLGPSVRRTAYRYRGTEKTPDAALRGNVDNANIVGLAMAGKGGAGSQARANELIGMKGTARRPDQGDRPSSDIVAGVFGHYRGKVKGDQAALSMRGDAAVATFLGVDAAGGESHLPAMDLVALSIESGEMPPSEGVIIGQDGKVKTQAVGYNGDHYLPFDLTHLEGLGGGQYVRTRATGGLTGEDIYTSMAAGVRQAQVVSNSGVFTLEFDPSFRGARRHNDKARRMIERYTTLLGAIDNPESELFTSDISVGDKAALRREAASVARDQTDFTQIYNQKLASARLQTQGDMPSAETIKQKAEDDADEEILKPAYRGMSMQRRGKIRDDIARENLDEAYESGAGAPLVQRMKLDGEGYYQAMRALKQEFPYYIRTATYQSLPQWLESRNLDAGQNRNRGVRTADLGYAEAGQTNARSTRKSPSGKTSFRSARLVPTRGSTARTTSAGPSGESQAETPRGDAGATPSATAGGSDPVKVSAVDLVRPGTPILRSLTRTLALALDELSASNPNGPRDPKDEKLSEASLVATPDPIDWASDKATLMVQTHGADAASEMAKWLLDPATPSKDRQKFVDGVRRTIEENFDGTGLENAEESIKGKYEKLLGIVEDVDGMVDPFSEQSLDSVFQNGVTTDKPPAVSGMPEVGARDSEFRRYAETVGDPGVQHQIRTLGSMDEDAARESVGNAVDLMFDLERRGKITDLEQQKGVAQNMVHAWSFLAAREASKKLRAAAGYVGTDGSGSADPKVPAPSLPSPSGLGPAAPLPSPPGHGTVAAKSLYPPLLPQTEEYRRQIQKALSPRR